MIELLLLLSERFAQKAMAGTEPPAKQTKTDGWSSSRLVPDLLSAGPLQTLRVVVAGKDLAMGAEMTPTQVKVQSTQDSNGSGVDSL
jgi:hypothetical protein